MYRIELIKRLVSAAMRLNNFYIYIDRSQLTMVHTNFRISAKRFNNSDEIFRDFTQFID